MANRKVLINRHTSGSSAPVADSMYLGEIAVAHETGKETLFTKNNGGEMVPFISCGQTIAIIDSKIKAADVSYDVKAKEGETFIKVEEGTNGSAVTFSLSSSGVASDTNLKALSAGTESNFKNITNILTGLTDLVITSVTGDDAIKVDSTETTTGASNTITLTHKTGLETSGFKKLTTDKYGHVTDATAVVTADIQALGFKTSAQTGEDLKTLSASVVTNKANIEALSGGTLQLSADTHNKIVSVYSSATSYADSAVATAIEGLDSETATTSNRHYVTAITFENGEIKSIGESTDPKLSVKKSGEGNVVSSISVNDHEVTYETVNVATSGEIAELSGAVESLSAATVHEFDSAFTAINALSGDVVNYVDSVSGKIESVINAMDKNASAADGQVVTTVSQVDGKVAETKANVKDLQLGGYVKDANATGGIAGTDTINAALSKLENKANANKITNSDKSIVVTEPTGTATTTDVKVNIKSGEKVIKLGDEGLYTNLNLVKITSGLGATVKESYEFHDSDGNKIGDSIEIAKDSHIVSITYDETTQKLIYKYMDVEGAEKTVEVDMGHLILETEVENGVQSNNGKLSIKLDTTGDDTGDGKFLTVGANGLKLDGVSDAIAAAVNALDVTDAAVNGQYVSSVSETDGKITVSRANVSDAVLNGYAKGEKPASTEITADDTVKGAISKLEHQIDAAKAAATTKVVKGTDAGNNMTITAAAGADNSVTYTVNLTDVASKNALDAEIAARKAVDGQTGQTYAKNTNANYIANAASLNDADVKLDAALKAEENTRTSQDNKIEESIGLAADGSHVQTSGNYTSTATTVVGEIAALDSAIKSVSDKVDTAIAGLDSTGTTTGDGYFLTSVKIADGKITAVTQSDKVNSASSADKVVNALSISGYASSESKNLDTTVSYNGSVAQSMTFGKDTAAGKSMSYNGGIIDVEIIDCGEY